MGQFYLFIALIVFLSQSSVLNAQVCNGYAELCGRSYASVGFPGTHNPFSYTPIPDPAQNQFSSVADQLQAGIRSLMLDGHNPPKYSSNPNGIHLCHTSCALLNAGDSVKTLKVIADFLIKNPTEIITIIWENYDGLPSSKYQAAYQAA
ncbi:3407_t:CDS:1, partial [Paraglomus occultum]